jgi:hypothetical protein
VVAQATEPAAAPSASSADVVIDINTASPNKLWSFIKHQADQAHSTSHPAHTAQVLCEHQVLERGPFVEVHSLREAYAHGGGSAHALHADRGGVEGARPSQPAYNPPFTPLFEEEAHALEASAVAPTDPPSTMAAAHTTSLADALPARLLQHNPVAASFASLAESLVERVERLRQCEPADRRPMADDDSTRSEEEAAAAEAEARAARLTFLFERRKASYDRTSRVVAAAAAERDEEDEEDEEAECSPCSLGPDARLGTISELPTPRCEEHAMMLHEEGSEASSHVTQAAGAMLHTPREEGSEASSRVMQAAGALLGSPYRLDAAAFLRAVASGTARLFDQTAAQHSVDVDAAGGVGAMALAPSIERLFTRGESPRGAEEQGVERELEQGVEREYYEEEAEEEEFWEVKEEEIAQLATHRAAVPSASVAVTPGEEQEAEHREEERSSFHQLDAQKTAAAATATAAEEAGEEAAGADGADFTTTDEEEEEEEVETAPVTARSSVTAAPIRSPGPSQSPRLSVSVASLFLQPAATSPTLGGTPPDQGEWTARSESPTEFYTPRTWRPFLDAGEPAPDSGTVPATPRTPRSQPVRGSF